MTRTNARSILTLLVRTFALWLALHSLLNNVQWLTTQSQPEWGDGVIFAAIAYALIMLIAGVLWLFADYLARLALAAPGTVVFESEMARAEWQHLAFSAIGLWQAFAAAIEVARLAALAFVTQRAEIEMAMPPDFGADAFVGLLRLVAGIALLLGARGLVGLIDRLRGRDQVKVVAAEPPAT